MMRREYLDITLFKTLAELKAEASRSYLGFIWWVLEPLLYMGVFYIVFAVLLERGGGRDYVFFLLIGLTVWKWFAGSIGYGAGAIIANRWLMQQVYIPKHVFLHVSLLVNTAKFLIVFALLLVFLLLFGNGVLVTWWLIPALLLVQILLHGALAGLLAAITPFLPDLRIITDNVLMLFFFLSGIFFDISGLDEQVRTLVYLNPMALLIDAYRDVLLRGVQPPWVGLALVAVLSMGGYLLVLRLIRRFDRLYPKIIVG